MEKSEIHAALEEAEVSNLMSSFTSFLWCGVLFDRDDLQNIFKH